MKPSAFFLVLSQIISTGLKFAIFVLFASYGGIEVAGAYTLGLAVVTPTFLFFNLGLREIYVTERTTDLTFQHTLLLRAFYGVLAIATASSVGLLFFPNAGSLIFWMSIFRYTEALLDIVVAYYQRRNSAIGMASISIAFSISSYLAMALVFINGNDLVSATAYASLLGAIAFLTAAVVTRPWRRQSSIFPAKAKIISSLRQGVMLSLSSFAVSFATNTPVLFIETYHSTEEVGLYSAIYHITTVSNILYSSISQLELRGFATLVQEHSYNRMQERYMRVNAILSTVGLGGAIFLSFFGLTLFEFVFRQDFSEVFPAVLVMGLVICFTPSGFLLDAQMVALQKYSVQGIISLSALIGTLGFSFILIPSYAVLGGVSVVLISLLARNIVKFLIIKREIRRRKKNRDKLVQVGGDVN